MIFKKGYKSNRSSYYSKRNRTNTRQMRKSYTYNVFNADPKTYCQRPW